MTMLYHLVIPFIAISTAVLYAIIDINELTSLYDLSMGLYFIPISIILIYILKLVSGNLSDFSKKNYYQALNAAINLYAIKLISFFMLIIPIIGAIAQIIFGLWGLYITVQAIMAAWSSYKKRDFSYSAVYNFFKSEIIK